MKKISLLLITVLTGINTCFAKIGQLISTDTVNGTTQKYIVIKRADKLGNSYSEVSNVNHRTGTLPVFNSLMTAAYAGTITAFATPIVENQVYQICANSFKTKSRVRELILQNESLLSDTLSVSIAYNLNTGLADVSFLYNSKIPIKTKEIEQLENQIWQQITSKMLLTSIATPHTRHILIISRISYKKLLNRIS